MELDDLRYFVDNLLNVSIWLDELVDNALSHATNLSQYAKTLSGIFLSTGESAQNALDAATVYDNIVMAIQEAEFAVDNATNHISSIIDDIMSDTDQTNLNFLHNLSETSKNRSENILTDSSILTLILGSLSGQLDVIDDDTIAQGYDIDSANSNVSMINAELDRLMSVNSSVGQLNNGVTTINKEIADSNIADTFIVVDKIQSMLDNVELLNPSTTDQTMINSSEMITDNWHIVDNISTIYTTLTNKHNNLQLISDDISDKIKIIQQKIDLARYLANNVKISLLSTEDSCVRGYTVNMDATSYNELTTTFQTTHLNNLILYITDRNNVEFLSLETRDGFITITLDIGAGTSSLSHPVYVSDGRWVSVHITLISDIVLLSVNHIEYTDTDTETVQGSSSPMGGATVFNPGAQALLYVSGLIAGGEQTPRYTNSTEFIGCIGGVSVNGKNIGLWNFNYTFSEGCMGCQEAPMKTHPPNTYTFRGEGFAKIRAPTIWNRRITIFETSIKTLVENCLLFLVPSDDMSRYLSVELEGGYVLARVNVGSEEFTVRSTTKVNNNEWVDITVSKYFYEVTIDVGGVREASVHVRGTVDVIHNPGYFYTAGVPYGIDLSDTHITSTGYIGCIKDIIVNQIDQDLTLGTDQLLGMTPGCVDNIINNAGFIGDGYMTLPVSPVPRDATLSISFSTAQSEGLIFAATQQSRRKRRQQNGVYYSLSIKRGRIYLTVNAGDGEIRISTKPSDGNFSDNNIHSVSMVKTHLLIEMTVDDELKYNSSLPDGHSVVMTTTPLFIGALPQDFQFFDGLASSKPFSGCISNYVFNGVLLDFANVQEFSNVLISTCGSPLQSALETMGDQGYNKILVATQWIQDVTTPENVQTSQKLRDTTLPQTTTFVTTATEPTILTTIQASETTTTTLAPETTTLAPDTTTTTLAPETTTTTTPAPETTTTSTTVPQETTTTSTTVPQETTTMAAPDTTTTTTVTTSAIATTTTSHPVTTTTTGTHCADDVTYPSLDRAILFGKSEHSHMAVTLNHKDISKQFTLTVRFRTHALAGLILYAINKEQGDFFSLQMLDGNLLFSFDNGGGRAEIRSMGWISDGHWHTALLSKNRRSGELTVDGGTPVTGNVNSATTLNSVRTMYIGGLPLSFNNTKLHDVFPFSGCIRSLLIHSPYSGAPIRFNDPLFLGQDLEPCPENLINGANFSGSGFIALNQVYFVGPRMLFEIEFRTTQSDGAIMSVPASTSRQDTIALSIVDGNLEYVMDNGAGPVNLTLTPETGTGEGYCDGSWHHVLVLKEGSTVLVSVDGGIYHTETQVASATAADTNKPLFIGGLPSEEMDTYTAGSKYNFTGCLRNVVLNYESVNLQQARVLHNVNPCSCAD